MENMHIDVGEQRVKFIAFFFNLFYLQINKYIKKSKRWLVNVLKIFNISDQIYQHLTSEIALS